MIRYLYLLTISVALSLLAAIAETPPAHVAAAKDDYSQEAAVIEQSTTKVAFDNSGNFTREQITRVRVQTDGGVKQWGLLTFSYQSASQTVEIAYVRVRKADGSVLTTPEDNVQDLDSEITRNAPFYSDLREKHVAVKGLGKGDILEYEVHWKTSKPLIPGQFWFDYNFTHEGIALDEKLEIAVPAERAVKVKGLQATQTVTTTAGIRTYAWTYSNLKSGKDPENDQKKQTEAALGRLPHPDIQISSFQSWEEVGRWYWDLQKDRIEPTAAIRAKATELTKGMTDDGAKMRAIYSFVSTQYRYIGIAFGIGRFQPHAADDVLTNSYGDCKDKHTLLASLLKASGITIYPALINASRTLDPDIPSPAQFNHVIGYLPAGKEKPAVWLDTTPEVAPFGYLVQVIRDKPALVMSGENLITLVTTPADPPFASTEFFKIDGKLDADGTFTAKIEDTSRGDGEVVIRAVYRQVPQPRWQELTQRISYALGYAGTVSDPEAGAPEAISDPYHISYSYNRKDYPDWKTDQRFTVPGLPFMVPPVRDDAKYPIWLGAPTESVADSRVELPKGYAPVVPPNVDLKYDFAEYHATYSEEKGVFVAKRRLVVKQHEVAVAKFEDYRNFVKNMQNDVNRYVQTSSTSAGDDLRKRGNAEMKEGHYKSAIDLLNQAVEADPKSGQGWNDLGLAYMGSKQDDLAIRSFQKQIEIDPHHPYASNNMGRVYLRERKYDDAIECFKKQIEITPQDKYAHANIGYTYMEQHKYQEAIPELEQAVTLAPDDFGNEIRLGIAYLRSGELDKGTDYLLKLGARKPTPHVLNDVSYELADASASLPKALEYAQQAVHAEEMESQDVNLDTVHPIDLTSPLKISSYWDTLGWVHFRLGHLAQAEDFLYAAWLLSQSGIEADHLGQVYEQQKKTEKAIHMYRLALSTPESHVGAWDETRQRLERLTGKKAPTIPDLIRGDPNGSELSQLRVAKLKRLVPGQATAEFFLLFKPGPKIEAVKFISGSEKLRSAGTALEAANFQVAFPEGSSARLLRRALLMCTDVSGCEAVLFPPESVTSVN